MTHQTPQTFILMVLLLGAACCRAESKRGADIPWLTYEAEDMKTTGTKLGPEYGPHSVVTESSHQQCVKLTTPAQYLEFTATVPANTLVVRYCLPDAPEGGGLDSVLQLSINGKLMKSLPITSRYTWLYGKYPFTNNPKPGKSRNFYNEARVKELVIAKGDVVRLQKGKEAAWCIIDLVDLEQAEPPRAQPANSLAITDAPFGAVPDGKNDATDALRKCIDTAQREGKTVWVPAGNFKLTGDIVLPTGTTLQGAGMWHTTFVGDTELYTNSNRRVRFKGHGDNLHLADFAIVGRLNFRNDHEPNDGLAEEFGLNSTIQRIWIEHTKTGMWFNNSSNLVVEGCRLRNTIADGINFCVGMNHCIITNCTTRGTGDDCFAFWPATHAAQEFTPGFNLLTHCTSQLPFLANGSAIYGGLSNRIENCAFTDITPGCAVLISTTFPTDNPKKNIDNNFSGTTTVENCDILRSGGYDHDWAWRAAVQLCLDRRSISGVRLRNVNIADSFSDGLSIVAPGSKNDNGTLADTVLENVTIPNYGLGSMGRHGLWVRNDAKGKLTVSNSKIVEHKNSSDDFAIDWK